LFYTVRNGIKCQMSQDNVQRFMKTYENKRNKCRFPTSAPALTEKDKGHASLSRWNSFAACGRMAGTLQYGNDSDICTGN